MQAINTYMNAHKHIVELELRVSPCLSNVYHVRHTFSSPMVNFPCVSLLASAKAWSFLIGSVWDTWIQNFTFAFVYSWPGFEVSVKSLKTKDDKTYINLGVIWQGCQRLIQCLVHLRSIALEETAAT